MDLEKLNQAFETEETQEVETEVETEEVAEETTEETETEETEEETEEPNPILEGLKDQIKVLGEIKNPESTEEVINLVQKGYDYDRVKEQVASYKDLDARVKQLYPDLENLTKLVDALFDNEKARVKEEYKAKGYEDKDIEKLLGDDERFKELEKEVEQLDQARETEKIESDLAKETEALNKEFGTDFKSYKDVDKEVKEKASEHEITLSEAYYLLNKESIISDAKKKKQQSMEADISEKKLKSIPKTGGTDKDVKQKSSTTKKLEKAFGLS